MPLDQQQLRAIITNSKFLLDNLENISFSTSNRRIWCETNSDGFFDNSMEYQQTEWKSVKEEIKILRQYYRPYLHILSCITKTMKTIHNSVLLFNIVYFKASDYLRLYFYIVIDFSFLFAINSVFLKFLKGLLMRITNNLFINSFRFKIRLSDISILHTLLSILKRFYRPNIVYF